MNVQQYHAGETIEATFDFLYGDRAKSVTATFAHVDEPVTKLHISGTPKEQRASEEAGYAYWHVVLRTNWALTGAKSWRPNIPADVKSPSPEYPTSASR
jgi:hypothetical protein